MKRILSPLLLSAALVLPWHAASAQDAPAASGTSTEDNAFDLNSGKPIEISADNGIEWNRDAKTYTARGNAVATQGSSEIHADTLIASYSAKSNEIDHMVAEGSVKIMNPSQTAYGDHADYDKTRKLLVLTGTALKIVNTDQTVTARDAFEYWQDQDALVAKGGVVIVKSNGTKIQSDQATSYFRKNADTGKRESFQVKAEGHVRIDTGKEIVTCQHAVYDPKTQIAVLTGNVVLTQGRSTFKGARAEVDMNKGISRLMPAPGERVHTIIQPKQKSTGPTSGGGAQSSAAPAQSGVGTIALGSNDPSLGTGQ